MKSKELKISKNISRTKKPEDSSHVSEMDRFDYICTAAYFKASARQFSPGHELDDWLSAEAEFNSKI